MPTDLEQQLPLFADVLDLEAPAISVEEILNRRTVALDVDVLERPLSDPRERIDGMAWIGAAPSDDGMVDRVVPMELAPTPAAHRMARRGMVLKVALGVAAAAVLIVALAAIVRTDDEPDQVDVPTSTVPAPVPTSLPPTVPVSPPSTVRAPAPETVAVDAFVDEWLSTDTDGSSQTMEIARSGTEAYEVVIRDESATAACAGGASTLIGAGRLATDTSLVIAQPELTCDDGTVPAIGPAPQTELANLTFALYPAGGELEDSSGVVWHRKNSNADQAGALSSPPTSGGMWPQSTTDEVRAAQELADAGDPAYTWQVDTVLAGDPDPLTLFAEGGHAPFVDRFFREVLGWEAYAYNAFEGSEWDFTDNGHFDVRFLRCVPDHTNPLYPPGPGRPAGTSCAPTLDDLRYESVSLDLVQPVRQGANGIWVVDTWRLTPPFAQADPAVAEAQATARLEEFLAARVAGQGAEAYVDVYDDWPVVRGVPLLYAATSGAPYEGFEFERTEAPSWPYGGYITFLVRLFADGGATVVEQEVYSHWDGGRSAGIQGGLAMERTTTTENGQPVPVPYYFLDDQVVAWATDRLWTSSMIEQAQFIDFADPAAGDPVPERGCASAAEPGDAAAIAQQVIADPDFVTTAPVAARVGGANAVSIDVARAPGTTWTCWRITDPIGLWIYALEPGLRLRLYLVDLPESMSFKTLAITVVATEERFDEVVAESAPIIESIEFRPTG